jgi:hypothetical protein
VSNITNLRIRAMILATIWFVVLPELACSDAIAPPTTEIDMSYFGMHIHRAETYWPHVRFGSSRLWDTATDWASLEPIRGQWHFDRLDTYVALALQNGVEPVLVLGNTPTWASARPFETSAYNRGGAAEPRSLTDWENYVRIVSARYRGKVRYFEVWNEPNLPMFYSGSVSNMVELTRIAHVTLKDVDRNIQVISSSPTEKRGIKWLDEYLRLGGGNYVDIIGYHFYVMPAPPEKMVPLIGDVKQLMDRYGLGAKPLWNTESGWHISHTKQSHVSPDALPADLAADYVARALILNWASGVSRFYLYAWDDGTMGLIERNNPKPTQPSKAYSEVERWLQGAVMESCQSDIENTWVCKLRRPSGISWIIWNPQRNLLFRNFRDWHPGHVSDIRGATRTFNSATGVEVGLSPQLFER